MNKNIAILGATSHIAKDLLTNMLGTKNYRLYLFTRSKKKLGSFTNKIKKQSLKTLSVFESYNDFSNHDYDIIINCVGVGTTKKLNGQYWQWFTVTEEYDNKVISYLQNRNPNALYISLSSGAVYSRTVSKPVNENSCYNLDVNHLVKENYYSIARLNAEAKHRSLSGLNIVDLRLFSYFSRNIDLSDSYLLTDIINATKTQSKLVTNAKNIVRDYVHPLDLLSIVTRLIEIQTINDFFDVYSAAPISKQEILNFYTNNYGLKYSVEPSKVPESGTGNKNVYYSVFHKAEKIGYTPRYTSLDVLKDESKFLIGNLNV